MLTTADSIDQSRLKAINGVFAELTQLAEYYESYQPRCQGGISTLGRRHDPHMCDIIVLGWLQKNRRKLISIPECHPPYSSLNFQRLKTMVVDFSFPKQETSGYAQPNKSEFCNPRPTVLKSLEKWQNQLKGLTFANYKNPLKVPALPPTLYDQGLYHQALYYEVHR